MKQNDPEAIEGTWELIRAEMDGEEAPKLVAERTEMELKAGVYLVRFDGEIADRGTYELSSTLHARAMILKGTEGLNAGRTIPCIYQLAGNRIRICYGLNSVAPTEFTTSPNNPRYLASYRRKQSPSQHSSKGEGTSS